jgi:ATP-dependent helicase/nuclease subunit A
MNNRIALDPQNSVVVEACAGSGKTWLLVSRIVRLLLAGVEPGEILAITFTRKAAQEMQARLHEWLHLLAVADDNAVGQFLCERGLENPDHALLAKARGLYSDFLLAQPAITINTFHGWFMQIIQRAPLNAGVPVGMQLLERTSALREEAWQALADRLRALPDSELSISLQWLFEQYGLHSTRALLENFVAQRAEWWAYAGEHENAVDAAIVQLQAELDVDPDTDPVAQHCSDASFQDAVLAFARALAAGGTAARNAQASRLQAASEMADAHERFAALSGELYTQADKPCSFNPLKKQDADAFNFARDALFDKMQTVRDALSAQEALRMNQAALRCGTALLQHYQKLKLRAQQMDFADLEWQVCRLLNRSDCAEYMQYKLDSRYRHVLLDEFQDTNPLQWQILQAWFNAAAAVDSRPTVFVVGDPKQSIYRFRRADARLFGQARTFLQQEFAAHSLTQNVTRRNSPAVLGAVNSVFALRPDGFTDFAEHTAHHGDLPGHVEALPLPPPTEPPADPGERVALRNPLIEPRAGKPDGARVAEAAQFAAHIQTIVGNWYVQEKDSTLRRAAYGDIMVLVRKRTHLRVYEHALRAQHIPFLTSRRGGLLDTLEAEDIQALLTFLITPFADLELARTLRSPLFACSDGDMLQLAQDAEGSWWARLQRCVHRGAASAELLRAHDLLQRWLKLADKLPVHDLLDRIYFEGDLILRYAAVLPAEMRGTVSANLQAFMEIALDVDAGRYPSLPRFLAQLRELRAAENESPDEGRAGDIGCALRIYTVHEAKGLEAPIVWLLDANDTRHRPDGYGVLLDWPPTARQPAHFSLYASKRKCDARRAHYFEAEENYARREEMNLLYVAMTRAKQALLVSGNGELAPTSWYGRIAAAAQPRDNPLLFAAPAPEQRDISQSAQPLAESAALQRPLPTGKHAAQKTPEQRHGIWLHALLQHMAPSIHPSWNGEMEELRQRCGIPAGEMAALWQQANSLLAAPELQRCFNPQHYRAACNEMPYVNRRGEMKRIDRLVEFDDEVWILDYKTGIGLDATPYRAQMEEYRAAMQTAYAGKKVRCALLFADGTLREV